MPAVAPAKAPAKKAVPAQQPSTRPAAPATAQPAAPAEPHSGDVGVEFRSLADGQHVKAGSGYVDFEVVLTNRSSAAYEQVAPVVQSLAFDRSADCSGCNAYAHGTLDRKDAAGWKAVKLVQDGERNDAEGGAFALAPGESRTVKYRLTLAGDNTGGRLPITADAYVAYGSGRTKAGSAGVRLDVENQSVVKVELSKPTDMTIGHVPTQLNVRLTNADGAASHVVTPYITGIDPLGPQLQHGMKPQDLTAEVQLNGEWKTLAGAFDDQGMIRIDTSSLARTLAPGESVSFDFRFGLPKGWIAGNGLELTVGAESDGVRGTLQTVRPRAFTPMADLPKWDFSTNSPIA
ncbi:hypothetical protein KV557_38780 [Kitasatospora aureofaciens]|uniref:hypothetical protein n=1 Tax=Kitasatospora aureofaciens TaxID=1894 RepID=UPI001C48692C|nr:hypothetical protein [Kitasatospora aureofaciens]MBV6702980.1 hypothetical protein [Kitasatospora aureofaciens]